MRRSSPLRPTAVTALIAAAVALGACSQAGLPDDPSSGSPVRTSSGAAGDAGGDASRSAPADASTDAPPTTAPPTTPPSEDVPALAVEVVAEGLSLPWDVQLLPDGTALVGERGGRLLAVGPPDGDDPDARGRVREVDLDLPDLFVGSEAGLMGLAVSPAFEQDGTVYACHAARPADQPPDVRVVAVRLDEAATRARVERVVVDGVPLSSGRHSGCRLLLLDDGTLLVGTGDAAQGGNPQDLGSLGGKVLAVRPDGTPARPGGHVAGADPRILTYGHRNVQGLALRPGTEEVWAVEHGPDVDDEVNLLRPGANYGWDPEPGYDESVPMTDLDAFPDAVEAAWSSGAPTRATSGAVFLDGPAWGAWDGALAVAELKGSGVTVLTLDGTRVVDEARVAELEGRYGRLRSLTLDDDGVLWVTTSNGDGADVLLRVAPRG
ncbi:PQQ-dependent sugar dehydrogenase [Ornithinimicrobium tianjinense]|uniref:Glucose dehydrogenase n=1 Tax=Ornithinimicrobium tianjinense TaxID=1195761 RepID=A0A917BBY1_9MICO|nr:PQQ-dependent sugar dehydrogenase [Ornithinimicrobium tianjinense]GGF36528.1 glucose dehydrogenase [Ornithinimicrobium tianjinense]